jgi:hypothetical protein
MMHKIKDVIECYVQSIKLITCLKHKAWLMFFKGWKTCYNDFQQWTSRQEMVIFFPN